MKKLARILLVDDYDPDLVLTRIMIEEGGYAQRVDIARNGAEAIEYLTTPINGAFPNPELICLDVNMPVMNGWEFLEEYQKLPQDQTGGIVLMMLSSVANSAEIAAEKGISAAAEFSTKPLTEDFLGKLIEEHFG